jgi:hypothetical protein
VKTYIACLLVVLSFYAYIVLFGVKDDEKIDSWATPTSTATPTITATPTSTATPTIMATPTPGPIILEPGVYIDAQKTINGEAMELNILQKDDILFGFRARLVKILLSITESGQQYRKLTINMLGTGNITKDYRGNKHFNPKQIYSCTFDRSFVDSIDDSFWTNNIDKSTMNIFESADQCWLNPDIRSSDLQPIPTPVPPTPTDAPLVVR